MLGLRKAALYSTRLYLNWFVQCVKLETFKHILIEVLPWTSGHRYCLLYVPLQVDSLDALLLAYETALEPYTVSLAVE